MVVHTATVIHIAQGTILVILTVQHIKLVMNGRKYMKKKLLIILAILCLVITGCGQKVSKPNSDQNNNDNNTNNSNNSNSNNENIFDIELSKDQVETETDYYTDNLYTKLTEYGESIYREKEYTKYAKRNDVYFASLEEIKDEYDVSIFVGKDGTVCNQTNSGIYFDVDKKLGVDYGVRDPITVVLIGCSKEQLNSEN